MVMRTIWFTFAKEGIHCYPAAADAPDLREVSFLAHPHRHMFHFRVEIAVVHNDRDIEFILAKRYCESLFSSGTIEMNHQSCEMLAESLLNQLKDTYAGRSISVSVSEDNENGAVVSYTAV